MDHRVYLEKWSYEGDKVKLDYQDGTSLYVTQRILIALSVVLSVLPRPKRKKTLRLRIKGKTSWQRF